MSPQQWFPNHGPQPLRKLIVTCYSKSEDAEGEVIDLGELAAGATAEINERRGWTFTPGERLTIQADGFPVHSLTLTRVSEFDECAATDF